MLQNKFEMPLDLAIKPSKIFHSYLIVVVLFSFISVVISTSLATSIIVLLFCLLLLMTLTVFKTQKTNQATYLSLNKAGEWRLEINNKKKIEVELKGECIVTNFLIWLNFSSCNKFGRRKVFHLLLMPDSADKELLRQLRVRLRFLSHSNKDNTQVY